MPKKPLRTIVIVNDNAHIQGGAAKVAINSARSLAEAGYEVIFFAASGPPDTLLDHPNVRVHLVYDEPTYDVKKKGGTTYATRGAWDRNAKRQMRALLQELLPSETVVHAHMVREQLTAAVMKPVLDEDFPTVITPHEYNLGCPYGGFFNYTEKRICTLKGLSTACLLSRCNNGSYARKLWFFGKGKMQQIGAGIPGRVKHYIFISKFSQDRLEPYLPHGAIKHFVRNPIEIKDEGRRTLDHESPFVFIGRMTVEKDPVIFARAAAELGVPAVLIGDGELRDEVRATNKGAQLLGWVDRAAVTTWMRKGRALVFPSIWFEGQPLTVQEAEAVGLPTITSDACAPRDYVVPGETGLVFKAGDIEDLKAKMMLLMNDAEVERMSLNAHRRFWSDPPTPASHLAGLLDVYNKMLEDFVP